MNTGSLLIPDHDLRRPQLLALLAAHAASEAMLICAARLAQAGPLRVIDAGNRFNAYRVARLLRGLAGPQVTQALGRIRVARAFTCYQVTALLAATHPDPTPTLVIDLLDTFYDESVPRGERGRLLDGCLAHLRRLAQAAVVLVSVRPPRPPRADPTGLLPLVQAAADQVWFQEEIAAAVQPRLLAEEDGGRRIANGRPRTADR